MTVVDGHSAPPVIAERIVVWQNQTAAERQDDLAVEEPLEIRFAGCSVAVTMRTPGDDLDLAAGFLFTEGIIGDRADMASLAVCPPDDPSQPSNAVNANPPDPSLVDPSRWQRHFYAASSCGVCGKSSIDAIHQTAPLIKEESSVAVETLYSLDGELRRAQTVFGRTGGLHAAGLFDLAGKLLLVREDIGRHNAVDKVIGHALRNNTLPLRRRILLLSGRASFEVVQKALMAGIPIVAAVSAPSSLAVDLARSANMTLIGFLRSQAASAGRFNVYSGGERVRAH